MEVNEKSRRTIGGFTFTSESDARMAKEEMKKKDYIEKRLNLEDPESVLTIYCKLIENRIFVTPVGVDFLKRIQAFLMEIPEIDAQSIPTIPLYVNYSGAQNGAEEPGVPQPKVIPEGKGGYRRKFFVSLAFNVLLLIMVVVMFFITLTAENPNIINYRNNLDNKYAGWEQELMERETIIREKELKLNIQNQ